MQTVDLRGVPCPTNFVKAKLSIGMADIGDIIVFHLDEGEPVQNVSRSLQNEGHQLLDLEKAEGHYVLRMKVV
ncbi:MAG: sulfurtransferase TusA family protein [Syntrophotaleaceae bacterium]